MYRSNLDESHILKNEQETNLFWIRFKRTIYPDQSGGQIINHEQINCFSKKEWRETLRQTQKQAINIDKAAGYHSYEILHDPLLVTDVNELKIPE